MTGLNGDQGLKTAWGSGWDSGSVVKLDIASAVKAELGCLAGFVGGLLLVAVIPVTAFLVMLAVSLRDQARHGFAATCAVVVGIGILMGFLGAVLCCLSWRLFCKPG